jgi:uncharacterized protein YjbI with pentapeptide repeats
MWTPKRRELIYNSSLVGENLERFDLRGVDLRGANFTNANLRQADLRHADLRYCKFIKADLSQANLHMADLSYADMTDCDLTMSYGRVTKFYRTRMWAAKLRRVTYKGALFIETDLTGADFVGAELLGSKFDGAILDGVQNTDKATFRWWVSPYGLGPAKIMYDPMPGYTLMEESATKGWTRRENAAREKVEHLVQKGWRPK